MTREELTPEVAKIRTVLGTLIDWMAQSANSPISHAEAKELLRRLEEKPSGRRDR